MLTNFNAMLRDAYTGGYAVGSFNVYNYETMRGVVDAAKAAGVGSDEVALKATCLAYI